MVNFLCCFQAFCFHADKELLRQPRIVRVGLIQNAIGLPTTAHFVDQKNAIRQKVEPMIDAAGASGVNILCLQVSFVQKLIGLASPGIFQMHQTTLYNWTL